MDFGIIPKASCDLNSPTLRIKDYRNTTGPYFVAKDDPKGAFVLSRNPGHWLANTGMPTSLHFVPLSAVDAFTKLRSGEIDYIPGIHTDPSMARELHGDDRFSFFESHPVRKLIVASSRSRLSQFSVAERHSLYQKIRNAFVLRTESRGWIPSFDYYPPGGEGALTRSQTDDLKALGTESLQTRLHRKVTLAAGPSRFEFVREMMKDHGDIEVLVTSNMAPFMSETERPDFYIAGIDTSLFENIGFISYSVLAENVDLTKEESNVWLAQLLSQEDKLRRVEMLNELNARTLQKGIFGILGEAPYIHVTRKPFRYDGSRYTVGSEFWMLRRN